MCFYLLMSASQLRYGFPLHKIPSSLLDKYNPYSQIGVQIFYAIPFGVELRCLMDFAFSTTALDNNQFWQMFQFHYDLYNAKVSNTFYGEKVLGSEAEALDKWIFGYGVTTIIMVLLAGPLWFFSDYGGFVGTNDVKHADIKVGFIIKKNVTSITQNDQALKKPTTTNALQ